MRIGLVLHELLVGEALTCLLESQRGWTVGFVAPSVDQALERLGVESVRVLVADASCLQEDDLPTLLALRASGEAAVVLLASEVRIGSLLDLPVDGVFSRDAPAHAMFAALDGLARRTGRARAGSLPFDLSRRELECVQLVARGLSNRRIAELTGIREQSVKNVVSLAMRKLGVDNRVQVALRLAQAGVSEGLPLRAVVALSPRETVALAS